MSISISSRKAKARRLQNYVRDVYRKLFTNELETEDIEARTMGNAGVDIILTPAAKKLIQFDFECKNQEKLNLNEAIKQAEENSKAGRIPTVVFTKNHSRTYIVLEFEKFIDIVYPERVKFLVEETAKTIS